MQYPIHVKFVCFHEELINSQTRSNTNYILFILIITAGQKKSAKQVIEAIDLDKKSITWKVIEGDVLESYSSFTGILSCEHEWTTWTIEYEKKTEDIPEPLIQLGLLLDLTKDIERHLFKK